MRDGSWRLSRLHGLIRRIGGGIWGNHALHGALVAAAAAPAAAATPYTVINEAAERDPIVVTPIRAGVSMLQGSGGNITVLVGKDSTLLVDTGIAVSEAKIRAALKELRAPLPLKYAINTHWHWDHTDGNAWARGAGATLIAHANTIRHLRQTLRVGEWGHTFTPVASDALPTETVTEPRRLAFAGEVIHIHPYRRGHTDGDLAVYLEKADVLAVGDTFWNGYYPFIDYVAGGGIEGKIRQANATLQLVGEDTAIVPGHGPVASRADLVAFRDMLVAIRDRVRALKADGRSLEQTVQAKPTEEFDVKWGRGVVDGALFTELVYRGFPAAAGRASVAQTTR
jgi:glyoxylase-like metal-dependent hydrolase (beta-lactamase superfamily II)